MKKKEGMNMKKKLGTLLLLLVVAMVPVAVFADEEYPTLEDSNIIDMSSVKINSSSDTITASVKVKVDYDFSYSYAMLGLDSQNAIVDVPWADSAFYADPECTQEINKVKAGTTVYFKATYADDLSNSLNLEGVFSSFHLYLVNKYSVGESISVSVHEGKINSDIYPIFVGNTITEDAVATIDDLTYVKDNQDIMNFQKVSEDGKTLLYMWSFDGSQITDDDLANFEDIKLGLTVGTSKSQDKINKLLLNPDKAVLLGFEHHGKLPKGTTVRVNVQGKYQNGDKVMLYYYNEETGKLEEAAKDIVVEDGMASFPLEHCSEYVLVPQDGNPQTSSINLMFYVGASLVAIAGLGYMIISKKRKSNI